MKKATEMSRDELIEAARQMEVLGGSFAYGIARAFFAADGTNMKRLVKAFPELFEKFHHEDKE